MPNNLSKAIHYGLFGVCLAATSHVSGQTQAGYPEVIALSDVGQPGDTIGVVINGINPDDYSGRSVSNAGDVNGDGIDDLIIGAANADGNAQLGSGETYLIFGSENLPGHIDLSDLNQIDNVNGSTINGVDRSDFSGRSVSNAGDINGDSIADILIGAYRADPNDIPGAGEAYIVFGATNLPDVINLSTLSMAGNDAGVILNGIGELNRFGQNVSNSGDINNDGIDDIVIGASVADGSANASTGQAYVIFGNTGISGTIEMTSLNQPGEATGIIFNGINTADSAGSSISFAGDVNSDGIDDLLIAARLADPNNTYNAGECYLIYGDSGLSGIIELSLLNDAGGTDGVVIRGINPEDASASTLSNAGDINNDGIDDILLGAGNADPNGLMSSGQAYLIYGTTELPNVIELSSLNEPDSTIGMIINGVREFDFFGLVNNAGDINDDGIDDMVVAAGSGSPNGVINSGEIYLIFGNNELPNRLDLSTLNMPGSTNGVIFTGTNQLDYAGNSISNAGDINNDGVDDFLIGVVRGDVNPEDNVGKTYIIYGRESEVIHMNGFEETN